MKEQLREYLASQLGEESVVGLGDDASLLEAGVIDSASMVDLIAHLEKEYSISIGEDDMTPENFDSIDSIVEYVARQQGKN